MKQWILALILMVGGISPAFCNVTEKAPVQKVASVELKAWCDAGKSMTIVDARGKQNFDATLLPGAVWIAYDTPAAQIEAALPAKEGVIVCYCCDHNCGASTHLAQELLTLGYSNVYVCSEGLQGWQEKGYPVTRQ